MVPNSYRKTNLKTRILLMMSMYMFYNNYVYHYPQKCYNTKISENPYGTSTDHFSSHFNLKILRLYP